MRALSVLQSHCNIETHCATFDMLQRVFEHIFYQYAFNYSHLGVLLLRVQYVLHGDATSNVL